MTGSHLQVNIGFYTVTDSQGLVRYCYATNKGVEAPTLIVNQGDNIIIHFQRISPPPTHRRRATTWRA